MHGDDADFLRDLEDLLAAHDALPWAEVLRRLCAHLDCAVGTVHLLGEDGRLHLTSEIGLPPVLLDRVRTIPVGKGMAGIAAERLQTVQVCNLQTDDSGVVRPGARLTRMEGSIASPMLHEGELRGVLGVAKPMPYEFTQSEQNLLLAVGARLAAAAQS